MRSRAALAAAGLLLLSSCAGELETPGEALRIFGEAVPDAFVEEPYEAQVRAVGGLRPFTYRLAEGELPPGLDMEAGVISGVPTETGTYAFTVVVSDANLSRTFQDYSLEVVERPPPTLTVIAPQTEIREPVTVRLQVENASRLRAFTTEFGWDESQFELSEGSVESVAGGAAIVWREEPGRLHLEMAALGDPWDGELVVAQFILIPAGTAELRPLVETLFIADGGVEHYLAAEPGASSSGSEEEEVAPEEQIDDDPDATETPAEEDVP